MKEGARNAARRRNLNKKPSPYKPDSERWPELEIRKVPADSVPFGDSISRNGRTVRAAYHNGMLVALADTAEAARRKYREWIASIHTTLAV